MLEQKVPLLGICVGLQMFMHSSEEGVLPGLGWIDGKTIRFKEQHMQQAQKIPNMGWLEVKEEKTLDCWRALWSPAFISRILTM